MKVATRTCLLLVASWLVLAAVPVAIAIHSAPQVCEKTNDGCNTCKRYCGQDSWECTSVACFSNRAMCEKNAMLEGRNPKDCTKQKKKP